MRSHRLVLAVALLLFATVALAQSEAQKSEAQEAFDKLKTLEGSWEGHVTTVPPVAEIEGKLVQVSFRVASRGNVLMHDLRIDGLPDNPLTMLYREGDGLQLVHYCDAGNRPRMNGQVSPDRKTIEFDFLDLSGSNQYGHMHGAKFTFLDENHHIEEWTWMGPGDKPGPRARFDLRRKN